MEGVQHWRTGFTYKVCVHLDHPQTSGLDYTSIPTVTMAKMANTRHPLKTEEEDDDEEGKSRNTSRRC